ncbi:MAG: hypothetical protein C0598_12950 [Marinilabiliales bacterium]|nr:MAG: hypothetical protein C0598_12950 [Marinilabiliales bacterium]
MHLRLLLIASLIIISSALFCQSNYYPNYAYKPNKQYFKSYLEVSKRVATSPLRWNKKQWITAGSVVAGGVVLYVFDNEIRDFFQNNQSKSADAVSKYFFEPWGNGIYPAALIGSYYISGLFTKNNKSRQIALGATQAFIISRISGEIIKHLTHRHRPYQDNPANPRLWEGPFKGFEYRGFPSGHTISVFSLASFFSSVYKEKVWVSIVSYTVASGVALQRLYEDEHWASDVFIGAALGFAIGKSVYYVLSKNSNLSIGLSDMGGISLVYRIQ